MTASESTLIGLAKQTAQGTPNVTDADFDYLLFREAAAGVIPSFLPLDQECGGGAMLRNIIKVGVMSGGQLSIIPRPKTLGHAFLGVTGAVVSVDGTDGSYKHTFTISNQFSAPWYTVRNSPGQLLGEELADVRFSSLALSWRAARFVDGAIAFQGIATPKKVAMTSWNASAQVDGGPQFIAPKGVVELPTGSALSIVGGSFTAALAMPVDEQWRVGSYSPKNLSINQRAYVLSMAVPIEDASLYSKIMYDPAGGSNWVAAMFREARIKLEFASEAEAAVDKPYKFSIAANGQTGANANVVWSAQPIASRAGRQITMGVTGTFLASPDGATSPLTLELVNKTESY